MPLITVILIIIAGICHINRDWIEIPSKYNNMVFANFKNQQWWDPRISWRNKKSKYFVIEILLSTVFVPLTDFKHALKFVELLCYVLAVYFNSLATAYDLIMIYVVFGIGVTIGKMKWFA